MSLRRLSAAAALAASAILAGCATTPPAVPNRPPVVSPAPVSTPEPAGPARAYGPAHLAGWDNEDFVAAFDAYLKGCGVARDPAGVRQCGRAMDLQRTSRPVTRRWPAPSSKAASASLRPAPPTVATAC
jgi:membrane-bound lytic murein transglycosylase A